MLERAKRIIKLTNYNKKEAKPFQSKVWLSSPTHVWRRTKICGAKPEDKVIAV